MSAHPIRGRCGEGAVVVFAADMPADVARALDMAGYEWRPVPGLPDASAAEPSTGWGAAVVIVGDDTEAAWAFCRGLRRSDTDPVRTLVLIGGARLDELDLRDDLFDDFCITPFHPSEFDARMRHLLAATPVGPARADLVEHQELSLNLETYQAAIAGRPLDLTFMEYELLKFLAQNPGKVFSREMLLSRVWGYEYYGGARTVDVHVRRLRAKLGEEYADMIQTVRSVGYRFGQMRWGSTTDE